MGAILVGVVSLLMVIAVLATTIIAMMIFVAWIIGLVVESNPRMHKSGPSTQSSLTVHQL
jgi:hypothetical protein